MSNYVLDHHLEGERARLALMSRLLDPMHRRHVEEPAEEVRAFWDGWPAWSRDQGIDPHVGRALACADPSWWTQTIAFTAVHARRAAG